MVHGVGTTSWREEKVQTRTAPLTVEEVADITKFMKGIGGTMRMDRIANCRAWRGVHRDLLQAHFRLRKDIDGQWEVSPTPPGEQPGIEAPGYALALAEVARGKAGKSSGRGRGTRGATSG
jgi:hypothetical protein